MKTAAALLAAALLLSACGGSSDDGASADPTAASAPTSVEPTSSEPSSAEPSETSGTVVGIVIAGGKVVPQGKRVEAKVGADITLTIRSDVDEEIHVHSDPEHTYEVAAGETVTETFTVDTPGQVAVEAHELGVTIVQLVVRP
ncbi:hypothetical protein [Aeromicrobium stalagmiti]|uniref:hypothetical protein n=1 Tax=Aeromicrobium stalagmiti TaxID=2738988 RepID=UPI001569534E|nr:hypothetical protein [Aeromicrobium stalagmiti]NRQ48382.1 hypothetical protein [Aeromicrobium stalagmiti]